MVADAVDDKSSADELRFDELKASHSDDQLKKRGRCLSPLFHQVQQQHGSGSTGSLSSQAGSSGSTSPTLSAASRRPGRKLTRSSPPATSSSSSLEPSSKRLLRDVVVMQQQQPSSSSEQQQTTDVIVAALPHRHHHHHHHDSLFQEANWWRAELDRLAAGTTGSNCSRELASLAVSMAQTWIRLGASSRGGVAKSFSERVKLDRMSCLKCGGVLFQASTLACGHTFCKRCAGPAGAPCPKCGRAMTGDGPARCNVAVCKLADKWWPDELKAVELRNAGNAAFAEERYETALDKYRQAAQLGTLLIHYYYCIFFLKQKF